MFTSSIPKTNIAVFFYVFHIPFLLFVFYARRCSAADAVASSIHHDNMVETVPNRLPQYSHDSLPQVKIRLYTTLPLGFIETSLSLYPTKLSPFTVSKGVAFLPHEWGVWGAEVLDGPFMAKWKEKEIDRILRRSGPEGLESVEEEKEEEGEKAKKTLEKKASRSKNEKREELDDDYKEGERLVCKAAGFQRMKYELDFTLRESWGAAIWEVECWVPRKGRLKRWWENLWS